MGVVVSERSARTRRRRSSRSASPTVRPVTSLKLRCSSRVEANAADDVAMIPVSINTTADNAKNNYAGYYLTFDGEITVGQLFFGSFMPGSLNIRLRPGTADNATLAFSRTDGETPLLAVSGNAATAHNTWVRFAGNGDRNLSLDLSNGLLADLGYVEDESGSTVSHFLFQQGSLSIPAGKRLTFVNGKPGHSGSNAEDSGVEFDAGYALGGTGTIRNDSDMNLRVDSEGNAIFAGSWESGGKRPRSIPASPVGAGIDFRKARATRRAAGARSAPTRRRGTRSRIAPSSRRGRRTSSPPAAASTATATPTAPAA